VAVPLLPLDELNRLDTADLAGALSKLFEHAPLLFERLARRRPFRSYRELLDAAREEVLRMSESEQAALLAAHPPIGAPQRQLSAASRREQGDVSSPEIEAELARLNEEYVRRFGFPFVVFVDRRSKAEILVVLRQRLDNSRAVELRTGLEALLAIAESRAGLR
jgi:OHCU decarboxylase